MLTHQEPPLKDGLQMKALIDSCFESFVKDRKNNLKEGIVAKSDPEDLGEYLLNYLNYKENNNREILKDSNDNHSYTIKYTVNVSSQALFGDFAKIAARRPLTYREIKELAQEMTDAAYEKDFKYIIESDFEETLVNLYFRVASLLNEKLLDDQYPYTIKDVEQCFNVHLDVKAESELADAGLSLASGDHRVIALISKLYGLK